MPISHFQLFPQLPQRPIVLALLGAFWPDHDAAGPNQSLAGLARALGDEFEFKILARDRPFAAREPAVPTGVWVDRQFARFRYCRVLALGATDLSEILRSTPHDVLMMNGFFDREFTIPALFLRWVGRIPRKPTILSTRGEFGEGAIGLKSGRKRAYLGLARRLGLLSDVWLHATSSQEASDVRRWFPWCGDIVIAPNINRLSEFRIPHSSGGGRGVRLLFLGRIARVKNLRFALEALRNVQTSVSFDIIGPVNDAGYWKECERIVAMLPAHVTVRQLGSISNADVQQTMRGYDLLFLPTAGENFGHAIFEALSSGVPVLISDQTPWRNLEKKNGGWDLPLDDTQRFSSVIDSFSKLDFAARVNLARGARALAEEWVKESDAVDRNRAMLRQVLGRTGTATSVASGEVCP